MKHYIVIFLILLGFCTKAQQQELLDNTWYLEKVIINEENIFPPKNGEVEIVSANFIYENANSYFTSSVFNTYTANIGYGDNKSFILNLANGSMMDPQIEETNLFENLYFWEFYGLGNNDLFQYEINNLENKLQLIVTNNIGNKAIYYSESLSIEEAFKNKITIAPNPVQDVVQFQNLPKDYQNLTIEIYDVQGKLIMNQSLKENNLNVSKLTKGVYFVKAKNGNEIITSQKIIKK